MRHPTVLIRAEWDDEAEVWVATSPDVSGLAIEAATMEELMRRVPGVLQDLVALNGIELEGEPGEISFQVVASQLGRVTVPAE